MQNIDLAILGGSILTLDPRMTTFSPTGGIAVHNGKIICLGSSAEIKRKYKAKKVVDGSNCLIMPGLVNTHSHSPLVFLRGITDGLTTSEWLKKVIFPIEKKFVSREFVTAATRLAVCEMLLAGTTTFNDHYFFSREVAEVASSMGMRCVVGEAFFDFPSPSHKTPEDALAYTEESLQQWKESELVTISVAPHTLDTCSPELIRKSFALAHKYDALVHIHLSESLSEVELVKKQYGATPVTALEQLGLLESRLVAAHCVRLTPAEIDLLAKRKVGISHNPESNLILGSGIAPIAELIMQGALVGLGTDSAASNHDLSLLSEVDFAAKLQKGVHQDPTLMTGRQAVQMITSSGAKVLHLDHKIGSLEVGKQADIILMDFETPHMTPLYDPYVHIVHAATAADVKTVIVNGVVLIQDRRFLNCNVEDIYSQAELYSAKIKDFMQSSSFEI